MLIKNKHLIQITLQIIFLSIFLIFCNSCAKKEEDKKTETVATDEKKSDEPVSNKYNFFETTLSKNGNKIEEITLFGKAKSLNNYSVVPAVQGQITKLFIKNGSTVRAGQLLANIDDKVLRSGIDQLKADYQISVSEIGRAKQLFDSAKKLYNTGLMPKQDYDNTFFNLQQAKIRAEAAKSKISSLNTQLGYGKVIAENAGTIYNLLPVGSLVGPNMTAIATINAIPSDIEFNIPFNLKLSPSDKLYIDNKEYDINYLHSDPATNNKMANVKISGNKFENSQPVNAIFKKVTNGVQVPQASVISYKGSPVVFKVIKEKDNCSVIATPVKIIYSDDKLYLISGIQSKTKIIAKGAEILEDKEKIECEK
ncbi:MAG: efflux RND transporter periplasmic adaptor subunit [Candidatus Sericytochromatia bacterium]|nr:efflux RND transporter periplasmic adaptor subunit [Candidatus Sericytochromatia bacterium]